FRLYLNGRVFSALGGVLAVAATYAAGRVLGGGFAGVAAAGIVAVSVPLVQHAHYSTTSSISAGFVALCLWATLASVRRFRGWAFVLAGIAAGLAAGSRYNAAAVSLVVFFGGWFLLYRERTVRRAGGVLAGCLLFPLMFVFTTPHVIFDTVFFIEEFQFITNQYIGDEVSPFNVSPWLGLQYELRYLAIYGIGVPGAVAAVVGIFMVWRDRQRLLMTALLLAYIVPYGYVVLRTIRPLGADQMLVPIVPAVALLAALGADWFRRWVPGPVVWAVLVVPIWVYSLGVVSLFARPDTRYDVQAWAWEHLPPASHVHLYGPYNVPLDETRYTVTRTFGTGEVVMPDELRALGADYVIVSDAWLQNFQRAAFIPPDFVAAVLAPLEALAADAPTLYQVSRPHVLGDGDPLHSATYWHQPGLTVYCLTDAACRAVR
ncbi:MAG: glycosyltransferase family 39 protein, partial [Chloroflexota bacterium]